MHSKDRRDDYTNPLYIEIFNLYKSQIEIYIYRNSKSNLPSFQTDERRTGCFFQDDQRHDPTQLQLQRQHQSDRILVCRNQTIDVPNNARPNLSNSCPKSCDTNYPKYHNLLIIRRRLTTRLRPASSTDTLTYVPP